ncbi:MAG: type II toxin-antitoxin system Phd/YefM family antitoxin [Bauldia sp.]|nr:type II toxin-antitoxin system Phd/YefM family antitoxin [Bauldia sp.]
MATWQIQQAKSKLSELIERSKREGPQTITKHGKPSAVILSMEEYDSLRRNEPDLVDVLFRLGPKFDDLDIERSKDTGREVELE